MQDVQIWRYAAAMTFGEYLRQAMKNAGYASAVSLARETGLSESAISKWRDDVNTPTAPALRQLAAALKVDILELVVVAGILTWQEARLKGPIKLPEPINIDDLLAKSSLSDSERELLANRLHQLRSGHTSIERSKRRKDNGDNPDRRQA